MVASIPCSEEALSVPKPSAFDGLETAFCLPKLSGGLAYRITLKVARMGTMPHALSSATVSRSSVLPALICET